jgi:hypothetical protein
MKVEQAINLFKEYQRVNSKKTPSTPTGLLFPGSTIISGARN